MRLARELLVTLAVGLAACAPQERGAVVTQTAPTCVAPPPAPPPSFSAPPAAAIPDAGIADAGTSQPDAGNAPPPQYVSVTADQLHGAQPGCLYGYANPLVRELYVSATFDFCWVAWIADTGSSVVFNQGAAWDSYVLYVKTGNDIAAINWKRLGDGVGPVAGGMPPSLESFDLGVDGVAGTSDVGTLAPVVAFVQDESVHWGGSDLFAFRWDGQTWQPMADASGSTRLNAALQNPPFQSNSEVTSPRFARTPDGHVSLTWTETPPNSTGATRYVRTWNGGSWSAATVAP